MESVTKQITEMLRDLASQLGVTVAEMYHVLTVRAMYEGLSYSILCAVIVSVCGSLAVYFLYRGFTYVQTTYTDTNGMECYHNLPDGILAMRIAAIFALVIALGALLQFPFYLTQWLSPEASAVEQLLHLIH